VGVEVETRFGRIEGIQHEGLQSFRGVPYAMPPTGDLRFCAPVAPEPWCRVRPAVRFATPCPQQGHPVPGMAASPPHDEDCLYLNVYTPCADDRRRPVFFWIHGGGFTLGAGSQDLYRGDPLARRGDIVVVTINYRLGALGYLYPGPDAADWNGTANAGQLDQTAALRWVRDNIAAFGGDPDCVTIAGESAGAAAVGALLAMPAARGLFHRAVLQSGTANRLTGTDRAGQLTAALLAELDLEPGDVQALREAPAGRIVAAQGRAVARIGADRGFRPLLDDDTLLRQPLDVVREGADGDIPLLIGTNRDEIKLFVPPASRRSMDDAALENQVRALLPRKQVRRAPGLIDAYRKAREGRFPTDNVELIDAITSDGRFRIPALRLAEARLQTGDSFVYLFNYESPSRGGALGACHALELPFVFGTLDAPTQDRFAGSGPEVEALSKRMMDAWIAFARTGNPSTPELAWPRYDSVRRPTVVFDRQTELIEAPLEAERAAWEGVF